MADDNPPSDADIIDELASIVARVADLMKFTTTGPNDIPDAHEVTNRLRHMRKHEEAKELETLIARAEKLKSASSASS